MSHDPFISNVPMRSSLTSAEIAAGWRVLNTNGFRASSTSGASLASDKIGNTFNTNIKLYSFATGADKYIVSGGEGGLPFIWGPPDRPLTAATLRFMWGSRNNDTTSDVVWNFQAIQAQTADHILNITDANVRNVLAALTSACPGTVDKYKIDDIPLTLTNWEDRPTMYVLSRNGTSGSDVEGAAAIVYGVQIIVKST